MPPPLRDHGNYVISINRFVKWLGQKVEEAGITVFTGFAASELLFDEQFGSGRVIGVRTDDKGVDKEGRQKANFEPGYDLHAKITILAEGSRGSCAKQLIERQQLEDPEHAQTYGIGIKELWEIPAGRVAKGEVHLHAWAIRSPRRSTAAPGSTASATRWSRSVTLPGSTTRIRAPIRTTSSSVSSNIPSRGALLEGGKMVRYGAKSLPYGGWLTMPQHRRRWLDAARRFGQLAEFAATEGHSSRHQVRHAGGGDGFRRDAFRQLHRSRSSSEYKLRVDQSWIREELYPVRNFHQGFEHGLIDGLAKVAVQQLLARQQSRPRLQERGRISAT